VNPTKLPKYAVIIRWGNVELNILGRTAIVSWGAVAVAALAKHYFGL
jgi:hypothetical protein